jgi:Family of unknown function (DUF6221)
MSELVAFCNARLDEDEAAARAAASGPWMPRRGPNAARVEHIARHDPARVLREVAANRAILEYYVEPPNGFRTGNAEVISSAEGGSGRAAGVLTVIEAIVLDLAAVWSDHPDYDSAWGTAGTQS